MIAHYFLFSPGAWIGEGKVSFSMSPEVLRYYTKWVVDPKKEGAICCEQRVEKEGGGEDVFNNFTISDIEEGGFNIELTNESLGTVRGRGVIDAKTIAWEFRSNEEFQGFEVYELQENGDYMLHAEYSSSEDFRTIIEGRLWQKAPKEKKEA